VVVRAWGEWTVDCNIHVAERAREEQSSLTVRTHIQLSAGDCCSLPALCALPVARVLHLQKLGPNLARVVMKGCAVGRMLCWEHVL